MTDSSTSVPLAPSKKSKTPIIVAVVAIVVVVALVAVYFALPNLSGSSDKLTLKDGDYIEYNITGMASIISVSGTARLDVTNVTSTGYDAVITFTGIPGATTSTSHYNYSDDNVASEDYGTKVGTEKISTPWGLKTVDKYVDVNGTTTTTTYVGSELPLPYRVDTTGDGFTMSMILTSTNIDAIKNANA